MKIGSATSDISVKSDAKVQKKNDLCKFFGINLKSPTIFFAIFPKSPAILITMLTQDCTKCKK